jgi:hypothetical protein
MHVLCIKGSIHHSCLPSLIFQVSTYNLLRIYLKCLSLLAGRFILKRNISDTVWLSSPNYGAIPLLVNMQHHIYVQAYPYALHHILSLNMSTSAFIFQLICSLEFINIPMPCLFTHSNLLTPEKYKQYIKKRVKKFSLSIPLHSMEFHSIVDLLHGLFKCLPITR